MSELNLTHEVRLLLVLRAQARGTGMRTRAASAAPLGLLLLLLLLREIYLLGTLRIVVVVAGILSSRHP